MAEKSKLDKVLGELARRFHLAGYGSIKRVESELGLGAGFFRDQRRPGRRRFDYGVLFRALDALETDPAEFFGTIFGSPGCCDVIREEALSLREVRKFRLDKKIERHDHSRSTAHVDLTEKIRELDFRRHDYPDEVVNEVNDLVNCASIDDRPKLLAVYASACRVLGWLDEAQVWLCDALAMAEEAEDRFTSASIVQRLAYVCGDKGRIRLACALSSDAALRFLRISKLPNAGMCLADHGIWLGCLGENDEAKVKLTTALRYIPGKFFINRISCLINLGLVSEQLDELEESARYLREAREETNRSEEPASMRLLGKALGLQAKLATKRGFHAEAEDAWKEALEIYMKSSPLDAALAAIEVAKLQLLRGSAADARETILDTWAVVEHVENSALSEAYLLNFCSCLENGHELSRQLLISLEERLKKNTKKNRDRY